MEKRGSTIFLILAFLGLVAVLAWRRSEAIAGGVILDGVGNTADKVVGNSNVLGTRSIGPAFLNSNRSYMWQPSLMIPTAQTLPVVACGSC